MSEAATTIRFSMHHDYDGTPEYFEEWIKAGDGAVGMAEAMLTAWKADEWHYVILQAETLCEHGGTIDTANLGGVEYGVGYVLPDYGNDDERMYHLDMCDDLAHELGVDLKTTDLTVEIREDVSY